MDELLVATGGNDNWVLSPDGSKIYLAGTNGNVTVYSTVDGSLVQTFDVGNFLNGIAISPDGMTLGLSEGIPLPNPGNTIPRVYVITQGYTLDLATGDIRSYVYDQSTSPVTYVFADVAFAGNNVIRFLQQGVGPSGGITQLVSFDTTTGVRSVAGSFNTPDNLPATLTADKDGTILAGDGGGTAGPDFYQVAADGSFEGNGTSHANGFYGGTRGIEAYSGTSPSDRIAISTETGLFIYDGDFNFLDEITDTFPGLINTQGMTFNDDGSVLYAIDGGSRQIVAINTTSFSEITRYDVGQIDFAVSPIGEELVLSSDGRYFYINTGPGVYRYEIPNQITGTPGDDTLAGTEGKDLIDGLAGNDVLSGLGGVDTLHGGSGDDALDGGAGNDVIYGDEGFDIIDGGTGDDIVRDNDAGTFRGGDGTDRIEIYLGGAAGYGNQAPLQFGIGPIVTISNGTTAEGFEDFLIISGAGNDRFDISTNGKFNLQGGYGRDIVVADISLSGPQTFSVDGFATFLIGQVNSIMFDQMEVVFLNGGTFDDTFRLSGDYTFDQINLNGAGGSDLLEADFSQLSRQANFSVNPDGTISSNAATFLSFERFDLTGGFFGDTLKAGSANDRIDGGFGNDLIVGGGGSDVLIGSDGDDELFAHGASGPDAAVDTLTGGTGNDVLHPGFGDTADGGEGIDTLNLSLSDSSVVLRLGVSADGTITNNYASLVSLERFVLSLGSGDDAIIAGARNDELSGGAGNDYLQGAGGNDILRGGAGSNTLIGGIGDDRYYIEGTADTLVEAAGEGLDTVYTSVSYALALGSNLERLVANGLALTLTGNELDNTLIGSSGNDVLSGGIGADKLDGGAGIDTVTYAGDNGSVFVNLTLAKGYTNTSFDDSYTAIENVIGSGFADFLIGDTGINRLDGGMGNDVLVGAMGADQIIGGGGSDWASYEENSGTVFVNLTLERGYNNGAEGDTLEGIENLVGGLFDDFFIGDEEGNRLNGAMGADTLLGAGGADVFMFTYAPGATSSYGSANVDLILDFTSGEDTIELASGAFAGLAAGALPASAFVLGTAATDGNDRIIYDGATGQLWFDADGSGAEAAVLFATLGESSHPAIAATDFVVV